MDLVIARYRRTLTAGSLKRFECVHIAQCSGDQGSCVGIRFEQVTNRAGQVRHQSCIEGYIGTKDEIEIALRVQVQLRDCAIILVAGVPYQLEWRPDTIRR